MRTFISDKQRLLFHALQLAGELVFVAGPRGIAANIVGEFEVRKNHLGEDQLDMGDGTNHVHIDWLRIKRVELTNFQGEGLLIFFDGEDALFRLYRPDGPYPFQVAALVGDLF